MGAPMQLEMLLRHAHVPAGFSRLRISARGLSPARRPASAPGYGVWSWSSSLGAAALLWALGRRRQGVYTGLTLTADWLNALIKFVIGRPRPSPARVRVRRRHIARSYPSGHVMHYVA